MIMFSGDPDGAKGKFNKAHRRTRSIVERSFGVLKKRFYALGTVLRVRDVLLASKLIECGVILHNLAIKFGREDFDFEEDLGEDPNPGQNPPENQDQQRERRRNQLLQFFTV